MRLGSTSSTITTRGIIKARRICCCSQPATRYLSPSARCAPVNGLAGCYVSTIGKPHEYFDLTATDPLYREAELPARLPLCGLMMRYSAAVVIARVLWMLGIHQHAESYAMAAARAHRAAEALASRAMKHDCVILVGHGFFNRLIARELKSDWLDCEPQGRREFRRLHDVCPRNSRASPRLIRSSAAELYTSGGLLLFFVLLVQAGTPQRKALNIGLVVAAIWALGFAFARLYAVVLAPALMVEELSRSSSAAVSDFGYDACDEPICLATNLPGLAPGRLAEPGAAEGP